MQLISLSLEHFRSYSSLALDMENGDKPIVLLGENATGKTNVLEAISVLALLRSPRKAAETDLITWNQTYYRVTGICRNDNNEEQTLEVISQLQPRKSRACFINGVRTPTKRYIGALPLITFTPDDLTLFTGSPSVRRGMVNDLLCQVSSSYLQALSEYEKCVKQRNTLLKQIREGEQQEESLSIWDEKIATLGAVITVDRLQLFETLQMTILRELTSLGEKPQSACFQYVRKSTTQNEADIRNELLAQLLEHRSRDIIIANTTIGPHRDDWILQMNGRDIATFASRGQQRAALLALLLLQASFLELNRGEKPILLLDDVFSEFDASHRKAVLQTLSRNQIIITTVGIDEDFKEQAHVIPCPLKIPSSTS